jgi:hypothetical protein
MVVKIEIAGQPGPVLTVVKLLLAAAGGALLMLALLIAFR